MGQSSVGIEDRHTNALPSRRAHCLDAANHWTVLNAAIAKQNGKEVRKAVEAGRDGYKELIKGVSIQPIEKVGPQDAKKAWLSIDRQGKERE